MPFQAFIMGSVHVVVGPKVVPLDSAGHAVVYLTYALLIHFSKHEMNTKKINIGDLDNLACYNYFKHVNE